MSEHPVGSQQFRQYCVEQIKRYDYENLGNFFERYLAGEDFDESKLEKLGYDYWGSYNLSEYINHPHDHYYKNALSWE
jgi:hypothetical protein